MRILETLARVELTDGLTMAQLVAETGSRLPRDATIVAIVTSVTEDTAVALGNLVRRGFAVTAIAIDPSQPLHAVAVADTWDPDVASVLVETTDGGASWRRGATRVNDLGVTGPVQMTDGGATWIVSEPQACTAASGTAAFTCPPTAGGPGSIVAVPGQPGTLVSRLRVALCHGSGGSESPGYSYSSS